MFPDPVWLIMELRSLVCGVMERKSVRPCECDRFSYIDVVVYRVGEGSSAFGMSTKTKPVEVDGPEDDETESDRVCA